MINRISVPVDQGAVSAGSIETAYAAAGEGEPLVLVHRAGEGAVTWYKIFGPLSERFRVIAPDVVGFGESGKPPPAPGTDSPADRPRLLCLQSRESRQGE